MAHIPTHISDDEFQQRLGEIPDIGNLRDQFTQRFQSAKIGFDTDALREIAENPLGLTQEQMGLLIKQLSQIQGGVQEQQTNRLKQATAGAPASAKRQAVAKQNKDISGEFAKAVTSLQSGGIDRNFQALLSIIQTNFQQQQLDIQRQQADNAKKSALFKSLASFVPLGEAAFDFFDKDKS